MSCSPPWLVAAFFWFDRILDYCSKTRDPLVPSVWGKLDDKDNPYANKKGGCSIL